MAETKDKIKALSYNDALVHLKKGVLSPVYIIFGEEKYLQDDLIDRIIKISINPAMKDFNLDIFYASETDVEKIIGKFCDMLNPGGYLVVANIPYYITSAVIRHLLESKHAPRRVVLTIQKEVAQRICAQPGDLSLLALSVQVYGRPHITAHIPADAFYPPPKVDSAVLRVDLYPTPAIPPPLLEAFFHLSKAGFSQKRKTLRNALSGGLGWSTAKAGELLQTAGIDPFRRAESLSLDEWHTLTQAYTA